MNRRAAAAAAVVLVLAVTGCSESSQVASTQGGEATTSASTSAPSESPTPAGERLRGLSDFPVTVTPDPSWTPVEPGQGTLSFGVPEGIRAISVHAVSSLASTPQDQVPQDVAAFLQDQRTDIVVSDVRSVTQSGLPAQRFRITMTPGRSPSDLWKARNGTGYKPLPTDPMEVVAVRSSQELVFLWTEWSPEDEAAALAAFEAALPSVTVE